MKNVSLLIKPASSLCNLCCRYCFYDDVSGNRSVKSMGLMTSETAEKLIRSACEAVEPGGTISFAFQGGEPTLAGLDFYRNFLEIESRYERPGIRVSRAIQTNGVVLDEEWASFLREHQFLVGLSADGTKDLNDLYRKDREGKGTWNRITSVLHLLQKNRVEVNLLCVVTGQCARSPQKVYHTLKKLGVQYLQFIPCLDPLKGQRGEAPYSLSPDAYGKFLCGLFDAWYLDWKSGEYVSIRLFDDYVHLMMGLPSGSCATSGSCGSYFVVESDGSLYPCDFYVLDEWRLGTLENASLPGAGACALARKFQEEGLKKPDACAGCKWFPICLGGCKRDWQPVGGKLQNYYCPSFQRFFEYTAPRLAEVARTVAQTPPNGY
ncbi:anaerobic sulfatase maturase [Caproiciproducens sp. NJN-50]|uniref:anaerobic sulfatase maturase n=1 Tax=Acutalibacteraceae TaxID=3082771 RepID=UPI000FFE313B|nr:MULTISPECIES: anaerobic sulfatase maturase [Acutalibacteraceae]QAT50957.1 anaerobic sulfatase maturase [Caproiciproducens sp. NJN-50]